MTHFWSVNCYGKVFTLSTNEQHWKELNYTGIELKRVSAVHFFTWGVGGDHQIYIYIPSKDVPIRCQEVTYENERWNPYGGFCDKLLPTDRPNFSSIDGLTALPKEGFKLPSSSWEWESDWYLEDNLEGHPLEPECWSYSVDFPMKYGPSQKWNSMVRRRKWVRYRRFIAMDSWSLIPSIHSDPVQEPFIDVAVGGGDVPGGDYSKFVVWAVTILGRVVFRYGVTMSCPEGTGWVPVETPEKNEVSQISVGPTGLVWAVTWSGCALVRLGVTREREIGTGWAEVNPPSEKHRIFQGSVGSSSVWIVSSENKVWFRKGINGYHSGINETAACGTGWVEMIGDMCMVSVGPGDQVWALSQDSTTINFRTGITNTELSGKMWKPIHLPLRQLHRRSSATSILSQSSYQTKQDSDADSLQSYKNSTCDATDDSERRFKITMSSPKLRNFHINKSLDAYSEASSSSSSSQYAGSLDTQTFSKHEKGLGDEISLQNLVINPRKETASDSAFLSENCDFQNSEDEISLHSIEGSTYMNNFPSEVWPSNIGEDNFHSAVMDALTSWTSVSASSCLVNPSFLPMWFIAEKSTQNLCVNEKWHKDIITAFHNRYEKEVKEFTNFEEAIEKTTWVKTAMCQLWIDNHRWVDSHIELEQQGTTSERENAILSFFCGKDQNVISLNINEITCSMKHNQNSKHILSLFTAKQSNQGCPIKVALRSDNELEDWLATLSTACRQLHSVPWRPEEKAVWATTISGDVYIHNPEVNVKNIPLKKIIWHMLGGGHLRTVESTSVGVIWGLGYNNTAWVYTGGHGGGIFKGIPGCTAEVYPMTDVRCLYIYENQRWNPLTGFTSKGLPTDRYMWSDETGRHHRQKETTNPPSIHWQWISDWVIDYRTPGGTDNEGWQYAIDFPRSYHAYKSFTDYVRRRRWCRKCRLSTVGPWQEIGQTPLLDLSLQVDFSGDENQPIAAWAIATNGDVFCRRGVTSICTKGISWIHVPADQPFKSISSGGDNAVWAIASDGSAQLRHGITSSCIIGESWFYVEPPEGDCRLHQISAGKSLVLGIDENNKLWSRQEIVPIFKEGTHWKHVANHVRQVSVGPQDEVWAVLDFVETPVGTVSGVIARRKGITSTDNIGKGWEYGISGGWNHVTIRGNLRT